jgi:hypothetical protein
VAISNIYTPAILIVGRGVSRKLPVEDEERQKGVKKE